MVTWGCSLAYVTFANAVAQQEGYGVIKHWSLSLCSANASYFMFPSCSSQRAHQLHCEEHKGLSGGQRWCSQQDWPRDHIDTQEDSSTHIISGSSFTSERPLWPPWIDRVPLPHRAHCIWSQVEEAHQSHKYFITSTVQYYGAENKHVIATGKLYTFLQPFCLSDQ